MSLALWPVFEDGRSHSLTDEGVLVLSACEALDALAVARGRSPLSAFEAYAEVPDEVLEERLAAADGEPDLSGLPVTWHSPGAALETLAAVLPESAGELARALASFRSVLSDAADRGTRFHFVLA